METLDAYVESLILEGVEKDYNSKNNDSYSSDITQRLIMWENYLDGRCPAEALRGRIYSQIIGNQMKKREYELLALEKKIDITSILNASFFLYVIFNYFSEPSVPLIIPLISAATTLIALKQIKNYKKKSKEKDDEYTALSKIEKGEFVRYIKDVRDDVEKIIREYK
jgi:hypothetical protein